MVYILNILRYNQTYKERSTYWILIGCHLATATVPNQTANHMIPAHPYPGMVDISRLRPLCRTSVVPRCVVCADGATSMCILKPVSASPVTVAGMWAYMKVSVVSEAHILSVLFIFCRR